MAVFQQGGVLEDGQGWQSFAVDVVGAEDDVDNSPARSFTWLAAKRRSAI